jgi:hypothetical protein
MAHLGFNPNSVEPAVPKGLLPKGRYVVVCEKSEVKPTKKNTGHVLLLVFVVQEGDYKNKKIYDYINIQNENPMAQKLGQQHLAALCHAIGVVHLDNSYQLHGIPVEIDVAIKEATDGWEAKNIIRGFVKKAEDTSKGVNLSSFTSPEASPAPVAAPVSTPAPYQPAKNISDLDDDIPF